jgi:cytochrome d ubiquinol oxidase subunit I
VFRQQPEKFSAIEIVWTTGAKQPEYLYGRLQPDGTVSGGIKIPGLDSFLAGFSRSTVVNGLSEVPADQRATTQQATIAHWAFDTMVGIGTLLLLLAAWYGLAWLRRRDLPRSRWFYRCASVAGIASVVAVESGWITAEVGRQPWIVWEHMKVAEAVTNISAGPIWASFAILVVVYALIAWAFVGLLLRMRLRWRRADAGLSPDANAPVAGPPGEPDRTGEPAPREPQPEGVTP